ncbi:MAG: polymerase, beta-like protein region protein [Candidatus Gottesmanbacteria bacterium GW2011_GWB1_44_11c]|uniref:Polymerase, beta-like protein region protein n=2 Tax=Candidatus Gottesmaniibacteriota TaxID=1752720 RepID=A0A0G1IQ04_9BACT|nr:MAG: polymerase, beta-like protein region protein [Candidatus Gottesmanbacteria bacterium GW2011_GWB1_44_11c]KKT61043.1 MAG: polymerase, beta-like protein region protein [Candidatus Gottesmanbacteria bacterium GW2011_GWA1_44_24b]HCM82754.1 hypothetical protein [Patescibacteria group bacterium]
MDFEQIKPVLISYINRLKTQISVSRAFVYGSVVEGRATPESDIDMVVLSPDFADTDVDSRLKILYRNTVGIPYDLHVYGLTPQEYTSASPLTTVGVLHTKKTIAVA